MISYCIYAESSLTSGVVYSKKIHTKAAYMQKVLVWVHLRLYMPVLLPQASISPPQKSTFFSVVPS